MRIYKQLIVKIHSKSTLYPGICYSMKILFGIGVLHLIQHLFKWTVSTIPDPRSHTKYIPNER